MKLPCGDRLVQPLSRRTRLDRIFHAMPSFPPLPIDDVLSDLLRTLEGNRSAVLQAPPGAGKTTRVPIALLDAGWLHDSRVVMLEPRRLAARAAARRMAFLLGERVGDMVGYRMRMETVVSARTRIEVVTEGVLGRMLQRDAALEGVGVVIFDEFHERSLQADLGLALTLQTQALLRPELRVLVMSATLDGAAIASLLGGDASPAPIVTSEGRAHPVETRWLDRPPERLEPAAVSKVLDALASESGDILVFLPGAAEIRRVESALIERLGERPNVRVHPLHGSLPQPAQDAAIALAPAGTRKVVLATSIAETSLTIEGVRVVVDSGLSRVPRFSPRSGMTRLETVRVSRASADQRRGRAGRVGPGVCYRLWSAFEERHLAAQSIPEILEADLAPLALELMVNGIRDPSELRWLDAPAAAAFAQAGELLRQLGALDSHGRMTEHGRRMASLPMHPRLAHMVLASIPLKLGAVGCSIAALLADRDILRGEAGAPDADIRLRLELMAGDRGDSRSSVDREGVRRALAESHRWCDRLGIDRELHADALTQAGVLLAFAYPDRIAQRRDQPGRFLLRNGRGAVMLEHQMLARSAYLVVADLDDRDRDARIYLAAPIDEAEIETHLSGQLQTQDDVQWDAASRSVVARRRRRLGAIVLRESVLTDADPVSVTRALLDGVRASRLEVLPWTDSAVALRRRMTFMHALDDSWPDLSDDVLLGTLDDWLAPHLHGVRRMSEIDLAEIIRGLLSWSQRSALDTLAPTHVDVPSGSRLPVDYSDAQAPMLRVRLQELFGLTETPTIASGRVPLTLHLLSPAHRPVQVTRDLAGFWRSSYFDVRKDLRGRYPKHHWPENPLDAKATSRAKRRGE
jgi:ATP-dependent helicase HrpB